MAAVLARIVLLVDAEYGLVGVSRGGRTGFHAKLLSNIFQE